MITAPTARQAESDTDIGFEAGTHHPVPVVDFDFAALDGEAPDPRDTFGQKLRAILGLVLTGCEPRLAQARLAQLDSILRPNLRPHDLRLKWPGLRKNLQDQVALEVASLIDPDAKKKTVGALTPTASPTIENLSVEGLNEK